MTYHTRTLAAVRKDLQKAYQKAIGNGGWRDVGRSFGITGGMAFRIAVQGYEPKDAKIRAKLGLASMELAPVCKRCGEVHVTRRCTGTRVAKRQRRERMAWWERTVAEVAWAIEHREEFADSKEAPLRVRRNGGGEQ